ncbi:YlcI/YnfO family protein [Serratia plymuthica]|uniref:YlcI/YnfO family protein n=1 Tax=Serratia plymuthica TaxID=82996 RepID=UPI003DA3E2FA
MAAGAKNAKSQMATVRVPHEVFEAMESVKHEGESNAGFIVTAMQGEITRRKLKEQGEDKLLSCLGSSLEALTKIEEIGIKAEADIRTIVDIAQNEIKQRKKPKE